MASVVIGEDFAAGEVAFIMQLGALLEDLTVARARAGIEKLVHLTPQDSPGDRRIGGTRNSGKGSPGGRYSQSSAGRDDSGGRSDSLGTDIRQSGGHDGGIPAGG